MKHDIGVVLEGLLSKNESGRVGSLRLGKSHRAVLRYLAWQIRQDGPGGRPSVQAVCDATRFGWTHVSHALADLEFYGWLTLIPTPHGITYDLPWRVTGYEFPVVAPAGRERPAYLTGNHNSWQYFETICQCAGLSGGPTARCQPCTELDNRNTQRMAAVREMIAGGTCYEDIWGYLVEAADDEPITAGDFNLFHPDDFDLVDMGLDVPWLDWWRQRTREMATTLVS